MPFLAYLPLSFSYYTSSPLFSSPPVLSPFRHYHHHLQLLLVHECRSPLAASTLTIVFLSQTGCYLNPTSFTEWSCTHSWKRCFALHCIALFSFMTTPMMMMAAMINTTTTTTTVSIERSSGRTTASQLASIVQQSVSQLAIQVTSQTLSNCLTR